MCCVRRLMAPQPCEMHTRELERWSRLARLRMAELLLRGRGASSWADGAAHSVRRAIATRRPCAPSGCEPGEGHLVAGLRPAHDTEASSRDDLQRTRRDSDIARHLAALQGARRYAG